MFASGFDEANTTLASNHPEINPIRALVGEINENTAIVTCWKPTQEEIDEIQRTGRVWVITLGKIFPPMLVLGNKPEITVVDR